MNWIALIAAWLVATEILYRTRLWRQVGAMGALGPKIARTIGSRRISDHWKERILPIYAGRLFRTSVLLLLFILLTSAPLLLAGYLGMVFLPGLDELLLSGLGLTVGAVAAGLYFWLRHRLPAHGL